MPPIAAGQVTAFFLFDVAEAVDLSQCGCLSVASAEGPRLRRAPAIPAYVRYQRPAAPGGRRGAGHPLTGAGRHHALKRYGVVSLSLSRAFRGSWAD